jgi:hypothetical protein
MGIEDAFLERFKYNLNKGYNNLNGGYFEFKKHIKK